MARVIKVLRTLRNHWKKSTFAAVLGYYGIEYGRDWHRNYLTMRDFSKEALAHGLRPLPAGAKNKHITLLLNPTAGNRKAKSKLEKYAEPLLHLSGFLVNVVKTERIDEARDLAGVIEKSNIIAIAGGDGSLFETVTGLLRREDVDEALRRFPVAIIPLGTENQFAKKLFNHGDKKKKTDPKFIAESTMAIVRHKIRPQDVMEITICEDADEPAAETDVKKPKKPFYALAGISIGQFREAQKLKDEMPSLFPNLFATFWSLFRTPEKTFRAEIRYVSPCDGCVRCLKKEEAQAIESPNSNAIKQSSAAPSILSRIFSIFQPVHAQEMDHSEMLPLKDNSNCGKWTDICVDTSEFNIRPLGGGKLRIEINKKLDKTDFMIEGLKRNKQEGPNFSQEIDCQEVEIIPHDGHEFLSIDNEEFEVKQIRIKCLKQRVYFFTP